MRMKQAMKLPFVGLTFAVLFGLLAGPAPADTITQWTFDNYAVSAPVNNPAPTTGVGLVQPLGMDNSYTYNNNEGPGSISWCDIMARSGSDNTWRVRGPTNNGGGGQGQSNGWNSAAPQYTQGGQFGVSTADYQNILVSFDWLTTTQGVRDLMPRYTIDGSTWTNFYASSLEMVSTDVNKNFDTFTLDFTGVAGVDNNPNFAVQLVSAYDPTTGTYSAASGHTALNNSSGNWRFDNITFSGTPITVPEPSLFILLGIGAICLAGHSLRRPCA